MPDQPKSDTGINPSPSPHVQGSTTPVETNKYDGATAAPSVDGCSPANFDGAGGTENILGKATGQSASYALGKGRPD